jgi:hypothetical protein
MIIMVSLLLPAVAASAYTPALPSLSLPKDTTRYGEDDWDDEAGIVKTDTMHKPRNIAREKATIARQMGKTQRERDSVYDATGYTLEGRYKPRGDDFRTSPDFLKNLYTLRVERRLDFAVVQPKCLAYGNFADVV